MKGTLSKALQKYYTRKGNRILFSNGMTLNQLAWEMWERLGYQEIDPSVLSRVVNGERLFTKEQLEVFCKILEISKFNQMILENLIMNQIGMRFGFNKCLNLNDKEYLLYCRDNSSELSKIKKEYYENLLSGKTDDTFLDYRSKMRKRFWQGDLYDTLADIEDFEHYISSSKVGKDRAGTWIGITSALKADIFTHSLPPSVFFENPYLAQKQVERISSCMKPKVISKPILIDSWSEVIRAGAELFFKRDGPTNQVWNMLMDSLSLKERAMKIYSMKDKLSIASVNCRLVLAMSDFEAFFPDRIKELSTKWLSSEDYFFRTLNLCSQIGKQANCFRALAYEFIARGAVRKTSVPEYSKSLNNSNQILNKAADNVEEALRIIDKEGGNLGLLEINASVTKINVFKKAGENPPKNLTKRALRLIIEAKDAEQAQRLMYGD